ncbi:poly-beta-hydroxyalkanoate depolymerase [Luminiphilus syltensis NOR5-1B]|uniref:Poly-beta-hydroxyalkanoate depolymerase n=1 Tax=Luminiphilus syltensis NOR5-1B TaxID=565045 RepID=B8KX73_9GAMM|nr:polyhydroxyalkanoate depolymerase [Luminiphilus syltensis]EED36035.1 poly-beta-hydroxyalkanoate depolymerase [Luminiphilus syltensis NOR5-1B]
MRYTIADAMTRGLGKSADLLEVAKSIHNSRINPLRDTRLGRTQNAVLETGIRLLQHYPKRDWNFSDIAVGDSHYPVEETVHAEKPFCKLMRFRRAELPADAPKVLFVAAMSGHHATLSRETFQEFLPDHDVYVTDWTCARQVPLSEGRFGYFEYIGYVMDFLRETGPNTHLIGLCQAGPPGLAAAALLAEQKSKYAPSSMSFLASPMDVRVNPGVLTRVSRHLNRERLEALVIHKVPKFYPGRGRRVYPGMVQLSNFMSLSMHSHINSHGRFFWQVKEDKHDETGKFREFYDEYFSLLDATAEFYIETLENVFIDQTLAKGTLEVNGQKVNCGAVKKIPILTVEGGKDNMVTPGQCQAAADLCTNLPASKKSYHLQENVGHYGVFSGTGFREGIAPKVQEFIASHHAT